MGMDKKRRAISLKSFSIKLSVLCLLFIGPMLLPQVFLLAGIGSWAAMFDVNFLFSVLILPFAFIISLIFLISKEYRKQALQFAISILLTAILFIPAIILAQSLRSQAFYNAGIRAEKIILAVEEFQKQNGAPPKTLSELIPKYLDRMPYGVPPLKIEISPENPEKWSLSADVGTGMLNWDMFVYKSDQDYSSMSYSSERLGNWVYYHE